MIPPMTPQGEMDPRRRQELIEEAAVSKDWREVMKLKNHDNRIDEVLTHGPGETWGPYPSAFLFIKKYGLPPEAKRELEDLIFNENSKAIHDEYWDA